MAETNKSEFKKKFNNGDLSISSLAIVKNINSLSHINTKIGQPYSVNEKMKHL